MSNLSNQQINQTFDGILQIPGGITSNLKTVQDGNGNPTGLQLSSTGANVTTSDTFVPSISGTQITGAVARLIADGFGDYVSVKDFGALGNGVTNDTIAIQTAINAVAGLGGGCIFFPAGNYIISNALTISNPSIKIKGASRRSTTITQNTNNVKIFNITGAALYTNIESLNFHYASTPIAGATAIYCEATSCTFIDFLIRSAYIGIECTIGVAAKISNFDIYNYVNIGIFVHNTNDVFISNFIINANNQTNGALGGIRLQDKAEAIIITDGDVILGVYPITTDAASNVAGLRPAYNNFTNVFFDSGVNGALLNNIIETEFVGCWFSNGRTGSGNSGCLVNTANTITFIATRFFNCGGSGATITNTANKISFIGCSFESNSTTSGIGVAHGLYVAPNSSNFTINNCKASNGLYNGQQGYGIFISSGSYNYTICNNLLTGNYTGSINDSGISPKTLSGNVGYVTKNSGYSSISTGNTSVIVNHGLSITPTVSDILLSPTVPVGSNSFYVDTTTITSTQFTVKITSAAISTMYFTWQVFTSGN